MMGTVPNANIRVLVLGDTHGRNIKQGAIRQKKHACIAADTRLLFLTMKQNFRNETMQRLILPMFRTPNGASFPDPQHSTEYKGSAT
jgi:hypothetical protein